MIKKAYKHRYLITIIFLVITLFTYINYVEVHLTPKNSEELFQEIRFSEQYADVENIMADGFESNFQQADYAYMSDSDNPVNSVMQFTLIDYFEKTYIVMTAPGIDKIEVLAVEELPKDIKDYFLDFHRNVFE